MRFEVGDKIKRIKNVSHDLPVGTICTVKSVINSRSILIEEQKGHYYQPNFELVDKRITNWRETLTKAL